MNKELFICLPGNKNSVKMAITTNFMVVVEADTNWICKQVPILKETDSLLQQLIFFKLANEISEKMTGLPRGNFCIYFGFDIYFRLRFGLINSIHTCLM